jgi:type IV pilus assembly protein PilE
MEDINMHQPARSTRVASRGFTLIEVMVTVAIVAILASVAFPSYTSYIARARRAEARVQLLQAAQYMQRFYAANDSYTTTRSNIAVATAMPANLKQSPSDATSPLYSLTVDASVTAYTLTMAPVSGGRMSTDECGGFIITVTGAKSISSSTDTALRDKCWK